MFYPYSEQEFKIQVVRRSTFTDGEYRISLEQLRELSLDVRLTDAQYKRVVEHIKEGESLLDKHQPDGELQEVTTGLGTWRYNG